MKPRTVLVITSFGIGAVILFFAWSMHYARRNPETGEFVIEEQRREIRSRVNLREVQSSPQYAKGQQLFLNVCTLCHMEQGEGQPGMIPSLHGAPIATGDVGAFARILLHGMEGPVEVKGVKYEGIMPPATFDSDEDIAAVMTFVRNSWGNAAGPVTPEQVAKIKQDTTGRTKPWTAAELVPSP